VRARRAVGLAWATGVLLGSGAGACASTEPEPGIVLSETAVAIEDGRTVKLTAFLRNMKPSTVVWTSSSPAVATVDAFGTITGVTNGTATVTAAVSSNRSLSAAATVTVHGPPVATVLVVPASLTMYLGGSGTRIRASLRAADGRLLLGRTVAWSTADAGVAEVAGDGSVTARTPGGPIAIVASSEGVSATSLVRVAHSVNACPTITPIALGASVAGMLAPGDCEVPVDGSLADVYELMLAAAATVQVDQTSTELDPYVGLFNASGTLLAEDDNGGGGTSARVTLSLAAGRYRIWANSARAGEKGAYGLSVVAK
jgi:Big-like domain-containing protein